MTIQVSRTTPIAKAICTTTDQILTALPSESRAIFRSLRHVLNAPVDAPGCQQVVQASALSLTRYLERVNADAHSDLDHILGNVEDLQAALADVKLPPYSPESMWRRLRRHESWVLFLQIKNLESTPFVIEGVGAEIARAIATGGTFSSSLARHLRQAIQSGDDLSLPESVPLKLLTTSLRNADKIFKSKGPVPNEPKSPEEYAREVQQWFRNQVFYASDKAQQAVHHHRTQTPDQFIASARSLRERVESNDNLAAQICLGGLLHLRADLVAGIPLCDESTDPDSPISVDIDNGTLHFSVDLYANKGAALSTEAAPGAVHKASRVFVTPLPAFLSDYLTKKRNENPEAHFIGTLLPSDQPVTKLSRTLDQVGMIAASYPRFINTFAPQGIAQGTDRYVVAVVTHDPRVVPTGKFFYSLCTREETWKASSKLFESIGWGDSTPIVPGLPGGSQVVPTPQTVAAWCIWMTKVVNAARPGREANRDSIDNFHTVYTLASASLVSCLLALRDRLELPLTGRSVAGCGKNLALGDKAVGRIPGPRFVPLPTLVSELFESYLRHLAAYDLALDEFGEPPTSTLRKRISAILAGTDTPLFFLTKKGKVTRLGSYELEQWWPKEFGMEGNGGRHFFQNALRFRDVFATEIDVYVRHCLRGIAPASSTSLRSMNSVVEKVVPAIDAIVAELNLVGPKGLGYPAQKNSK